MRTLVMAASGIPLMNVHASGRCLSVCLLATRVIRGRRSTMDDRATGKPAWALARAHGWQRDKLERLLDGLDGLSPVNSPSPRNSVDAVIDNLIPLAAHRTQVVESDLTGTRASSRGDDSAPGDDVVLPQRTHRDLPFETGSGAMCAVPPGEPTPPRCRSFIPPALR